MAALVVPSNGLLRNPETHVFLTSPFMSGIIFFMMLLFLLPGLAYGIGAGCFNYSNLGTIISVSGANFLQSVGFVGLPLIICFIVLTAFINN